MNHMTWLWSTFFVGIQVFKFWWKTSSMHLCCNIFNTLVQIDELSARAASKSDSPLQLDKGDEDSEKIDFFFFLLFLTQLFLSHFLIQILTSHYLKPLFLLVVAAGSLASLFKASSKTHLFISSDAFNTFYFLFFFQWLFSDTVVTDSDSTLVKG